MIIMFIIALILIAYLLISTLIEHLAGRKEARMNKLEGYSPPNRSTADSVVQHQKPDSLTSEIFRTNMEAWDAIQKMVNTTRDITLEDLKGG